MEFRDLKEQYIQLKPQIDEAMIKVASEANYIMGSQVKELEADLAEYVGVKHCITCANGTDALNLALMAWGIGEGDAVFVPDFTFFSSGEVVSYQKATPVFIDVKEETFNIDTEKLEMKIKQIISEGILNPKVIVAVDLFGRPAEYGEIKRIANKYNLLVLEDSAQGFGGMIGDKRAGSFGDIGTTSFFPAKPLGCYGDGGAIFTDNDEWANLINSLKIHGKGSGKYDNIRIGLNSRLDTIQAAILQPKFKAFKEYELDAVNKAANEYSELLKDVVKIPVIEENYLSSWAQYTIILKDKEIRDGLQSYLKENGIPSMVYYQKPMHKQLAFKEIEYNDEEFEVTNRLCDTVLSLPIHPYLTSDMIKKVATIIKEFLK